MPDTKKKIAILGGGFNPPTIAYEKLVRLVLDRGRMDEVWLMPYQKRAFGKFVGVPAEHRLAMAQLMAGSLGKGVQASDLELKRRGKSYTIDTIQELREQCEGCEFHWIIGSDLLYELEDWKQIEKLSQLVTFICVMRPGYPVDKALIERYRVQLLLGAKQMPDVSASEARRRSAKGQSIADLVPDYIDDYIRIHKLYQSINDSNQEVV